MAVERSHRPSNICTAWYHPIPLLGAPHPTNTTSACPALAARARDAMFTGRKARDRGERAVWKAKADNMVRRVARAKVRKWRRDAKYLQQTSTLTGTISKIPSTPTLSRPFPVYLHSLILHKQKSPVGWKMEIELLCLQLVYLACCYSPNLY